MSYVRNPIITLLVAVCGVAVAQAAAPRPSDETKKPALWAVYYPWYSTPAGSTHHWAHWVDPQHADAMAANAEHPAIRSKAYPLAGVYDSDDPAVVRWHIRLAKAAGLDGFVVSWGGPNSASGQTLEKTLLPLAVEEKFPLGLCVETLNSGKNWSQTKQELAERLKVLKDSPACLRFGGKPVAYIYQSPTKPGLTTDLFADLRQSVENQAGPVQWVLDTIGCPDGKRLKFREPWRKVAGLPMLGGYGTFAIYRWWQADRLLPQYKSLAKIAHAAHKTVMLPVHPGFDNSVTRPGDPVIPRDDGATLRGYLRAASEAGADAILVTSFNEWMETTNVEPSTTWKDPYQYLKILAEWKGATFTAPEEPAKAGKR
jgi:hypothetical protein